jgi:hypothetical protein
MTRDFDAEIAQAEQDAEDLKPQMQADLEQWLDAAAPWIAEFWGGEVNRLVKDNPDAVKALGDDGRKSTKAEAQQLIDNARPHLQRRLVDERHDAWPHLKPQTEANDSDFRGSSSLNDTFKPFVYSDRAGEQHQSVPEQVSSPLAGVLGDLAAIFAPHDFDMRGYAKGGSYQHPEWRLDLRWGRNLNWSQEMLDAMTAYGDHHSALEAALGRRDTVTNEKNKTEAADLWGEA